MRALLVVVLVALALGCGVRTPPAAPPEPEPIPAPQPRNVTPTKVLETPVIMLWYKDDPNWNGAATSMKKVKITQKGEIVRWVFNCGDADDDKAKARYSAFLGRLGEHLKALDVTLYPVAKGGIRVLGGGATFHRYDAPALKRSGVFRVTLTRFRPEEEQDVRQVLVAAEDDPQWKEFLAFVAGLKDRSQAFVVVGIEEEGW